MSKPGTNTAYLETVTPDGVAIICLDHFPVNSLHQNLRNGVVRAVLEIEKRIGKDVKGVVMRGAGRTFCAGADITQFGAADNVEVVKLGRSSSDSFGFGTEELSVPVVAAIHGHALGGGFEVALGCHYRVIMEDAFVGLPEVNIGLLPGGQGTQRLPRLIGAEAALELMTSGDHVYAPKAKEWGVVDEIVPKGGDLVAAAVEFCKRQMGKPLPAISTKPPPQPCDFATWSKRMAAQRPGEPAPQAIIKCVQAACAGPTFKDGVKVEMKLFPPLVASPESRALRYMFFSERAGNKVEGLKAKPQKIASVGIVGAGLMGGGIAMSCADAGIAVTLLDMSEGALQKGMGAIKSNWERSVKRGSRTADSVAKSLSLIKGTVDYKDFSQCDLVVEAVFEDIETKKQIFQKLDEVCKPGAFMCSNTSALNIDAIASATKRPEFVMATHFFSPANVMKLLENVRGAKTSDLTIASMMEWGRVISKWPILVGNCPGFVGNRMVNFYGGQARVMLEEGASVEQVDAAATEFGMKMGPLAMGDLVGLDLGIQAKKKAGQYLPDKVLQDALVEAGRLGQKSGAGFWDYDADRKKRPSPAVAQLLEQFSAKKNIVRRQLSNEEIVHRLFFPLINEGFRILQEGMAQRPADIDVCYVHGYSFPRYRGGPMFYADEVGLPIVKETLEKIGIKPAKLLNDCIEAGVPLAKFWAKNGKSVLEQAAKLRPASRL
uniref:Peroxisomal bifunctional protein n=1 Tax=Gambierdiscus pacificus TaxID=439314 RepID=A0A6M5KDS8_9DINO|nr:peroxisomal bifunctional protein [Gambierdiscus pacificus]